MGYSSKIWWLLLAAYIDVHGFWCTENPLEWILIGDRYWVSRSQEVCK